MKSGYGSKGSSMVAIQSVVFITGNDLPALTQSVTPGEGLAPVSLDNGTLAH